MPKSFIVTIKTGESKEPAIEEVKAKGGKITQVFSLINAFTVEFPDDCVVALDSLDNVDHVEEDQIVTTQ